MTQKMFNTSKSYSTKSFGPSQDSHYLCPNCRVTHQDLKAQNAILKQKAHQSFMQVLQVQQLHEEELALLREQYQQKETGWKEMITRQEDEILTLRKELQQLQKNVKKHNIDFGARELVIDNIEGIGCQDEERSYLDESALVQFKDLLITRNGQDYVASLRRQIYKDFKFVSNNKTQIQKLFMVIKDLKDQNALAQRHMQLEKQKVQQVQSMLQTSKVTIDALTKENIFISQNLKRLGNDKLHLEKKVSDLEKKKGLEDSQSMLIPAKRRASSRQISVEKTDRVLETLREEQVSKISQLNYGQLIEKDNEQVPVSYGMKKSMMKLRSNQH